MSLSLIEKDMAISNYSELKTAIAAWMARSDLTSNLDDFIDLCESRISYGGEAPYKSEPLRILGTEQANEDITINSQTTALPAGFLEARSLHIDTSIKTSLDYLPPDRFWATDIAASNDTGTPKIYTVQGTNLIVAPSPDLSYTGKITYFKKLDPLSDAATTNWVITNYPNIYLYGSLFEGSLFVKDYTEADRWFSLYKSTIDGLNDQDKTARHSGSSIRVIVDTAP